MNAQEIFDTVLTGLRAQGKASMGDEGCMYRSGDGCKCAVGLLISDDDYNPAMEGSCSNAIIAHYPALFPLHDHSDLLDALQDAHDDELASHGVSQWEAEMQRIATTFGLVYTRSITEPLPTVDPLSLGDHQ